MAVSERIYNYMLLKLLTTTGSEKKFQFRKNKKQETTELYFRTSILVHISSHTLVPLKLLTTINVKREVYRLYEKEKTS